METKTNHDYTRRNRFTGESIELTEEEAIKHDQIFYHEVLATLEDKTLGTGASKHWDIILLLSIVNLIYFSCGPRVTCAV